MTVQQNPLLLQKINELMGVFGIGGGSLVEHQDELLGDHGDKHDRLSYESNVVTQMLGQHFRQMRRLLHGFGNRQIMMLWCVNNNLI